MVNVFFYLAELRELGSIQNLISEANRGSLSRLQEMLQSVREEMRSLTEVATNDRTAATATSWLIGAKTFKGRLPRKSPQLDKR
ncbi:MAG: hypothetical protein LDL41_03715 [Coleofasciculus sp. S288]|nr:hypothetical protein [Coleofasciculus sp. S288]